MTHRAVQVRLIRAGITLQCVYSPSALLALIPYAKLLHHYKYASKNAWHELSIQCQLNFSTIPEALFQGHVVIRPIIPAWLES